MKVAIHQPETFPWLGFFHKLHSADIFVLLDTVQFEKNNVQNRNKVIMTNNPNWLTIALLNHSQKDKIKDIKISWSDKLERKHLETLRRNYLKHPYFDEVFEFLTSLYKKRHERLADFNEEFIRFMADKMGIKTKIIKASELPLSGEAQGGTEVTLEICKLLEADIYLSGSGAKAYLDEKKYKEAGIGVEWQKFSHPEYEQLGSKEFIAHLSALDAYFNHGPKTLQIIERAGNE